MDRVKIGSHWIAAAAVLMLAAATAVVAADAPLLGIWMTEPRDGLVQISVAANGILEGRIVGGRDRLRKDAKNPDPARREQVLRGQVILRNMRADDESHWSNGTIYDPDSGRTYSAKLQLLDPEHLKVRGFIGFSLLGRTQVWTRYHGTSMDLPAP
jgi:uncharacterized protein (DUF2147 family)